MDLRDDPPRSPLSLRERFRAFVADELRYKRFLLQLEGNTKLMWWQERLWEDFVAAEGISLSADYQVVTPFFAGALAEVMPRHELAEDGVPAWCSITALEGSAPMQGWGTCLGHDWYFRARWGGWELEVYGDHESSGREPGGHTADADRATIFQRDGGHGDERYDASYTSVSEARYLIVNALREFVDSRA